MPFFIPIAVMKQFLNLIFAFLLLSCSKNELRMEEGPRFHFVPERSMNSNVAGLIHKSGTFQLYYPEDRITSLGWRTAESMDLLHWNISSTYLEVCKEVPINNPKRVISATVIHDVSSKSGLCSDPTCLIFLQATWPCNSEPTSTFQPLGYSSDLGLTWVKSPGEIKTDLELGRVRDAGVFFHNPTNQWILMAPTDQRIHFFTSSDLKNWKHQSMFGPAGNTNLQWEDPEMLRLPIENDQGNYRWLLTVTSGHSTGNGFSAVQYFVGEFDGKSFIPEPSASSANYLDQGKDFVGAMRIQSDQSLSEQPIVVGKIGNRLYGDDLPDKRLNGMLSYPRKLSLIRVHDTVRLKQEPAVSLASEGLQQVSKIEDLSGFLHGAIQLTIGTSGTKPRGLHLLKTADHWIEIGYDPSTNEVYVDRSRAGFVGFHPDFSGRDRYKLNEQSETIELEMILDRNLLEVFIQGGEAVISTLLFPKDLYGKAEFFGESGDLKIKATLIP
jgi:fructan beta-fructosidase